MKNKSIQSYGNFGFIFDLDGVLVDTSHQHFLAWQEIANSLGFHFDEDFNEQLKGVDRMNSLEIILNAAGIKKSEQEKVDLTNLKNQLYLKKISHLSPSNVLYGVESFLKACQQVSIPLAIGSASKNATRIVELIGLTPYFKCIIDGNQVVKSKPDPEVFIKAADCLEKQNHNCVVFEDSIKGIRAAKSAGIKTVGIGHANILTEADIIIADLSETNIDQLLQKLFHTIYE